MTLRTLAFALLALQLGGCATVPATGDGDDPRNPSTQPGYDLARVETDVVSSARERFGATLVDEAMRAPAWLATKRYFGMLPPPPPDNPTWRPTPPMALMMRRDGQWLVAENGGWRQARTEQAAEIDAILASRTFLEEPGHVPPCPDYGSINLVIKVPARAKIVRQHACTSHTDRLAQAAQGA
ncbi:hypothetical protein [Tsuneonella sp. HG222]